MEIGDKGWIVLDKRSALTKIAQSENLPCCTLCAMWCLDVADGVNETSVSRYAGQDTDWWKQANVYEWTQPWSALVAIQDDEVVNGSYGHTYLAYADENEEGKVTIVQSSIKKGYRVNTGTWEGNAGLKGFSVGVLTLPA